AVDHLMPAALALAIGRQHGGHDLALAAGPNTGESLVPATPGLELLGLVLELVDGEVDGRVEVVRLLFGEQRHVIGLPRDLRDVSFLRDAEYHMRIAGTTHVLLGDTCELLLRVGPQRRRGIDVSEGDGDLHGSPPGTDARSNRSTHTCLPREDPGTPI